MDGISFKVVTTIKDWDRLNVEWNELLQRSSSQEIFLTFEWLRTWWKYFGRGKLSIIIVRNTLNIVAIAPFYIVNAGPVRILKFIGTGISDYGGVLIDNRFDAYEVLGAMFEFMNSHLKYHVIDLKELQEHSPLYLYFRKNSSNSIAAGRNIVFIEETAKCVYLPLEDLSLEDLPLSALSSGDPLFGGQCRFKGSIDKKAAARERSRENKLAKEGTVTFSIVKKTDECLLEALYDMHIKRWEKDKKRSMLINSEYREFYREISGLFGRNGWLTWHVLKVKDKPIAISLGFTCFNKFYGYLLSYSIEHAAFGPGKILQKHIVESTMSCGLREIDMLRGSESYKYKLSKRERTNYRIFIAKRNLIGIACFKCLIAKKKLHRIFLICAAFWNKVSIVIKKVNILWKHK